MSYRDDMMKAPKKVAMLLLTLTVSLMLLRISPSLVILRNWLSCVAAWNWAVFSFTKKVSGTQMSLI